MLPNWAAGRPPLDSAPTSALFLARKAGSLRHSGHVGAASLRRPAIASSRNGDQKIIAALPAKYASQGGVDVLHAAGRAGA